MTTSPAVLLRLLQLADSAFPTGSYAYSNGLEGLAQLGLVWDERSVAEVIRALIDEGLAGIELPSVAHAHCRALDGDQPGLRELDLLLDALKPVDAFRIASAKTGRRLLESAAPLLDDATLHAYMAAVRAGQARGHHAVGWGVVCAAAGINAEISAIAFASGAVQGQTAAAVRLGLIGQAAAQRIAGRLHGDIANAVERAMTMDVDELGAYQPLLDLAGLRQPELDTRLFAS